MPVTNKRTRKALAESIPASLGDNIKPQDVDIVPAKKAKKNPTNSKAKEPKASAANPPAFLTEVILPGEGDNNVAVFDDCNTIRRKIRALLASGVKVSHFLKWIGVNASSYRAFMAHTDIMGGAASRLFYSGYVFFEKKRIAEEKEKTELRLKQEKAFPRGRDMKYAGRMPWVRDTEEAQWDELGRIVITSAKGKVIQYIC